MATWNPESTEFKAANKETIVFPEPTSPWIILNILLLLNKSWLISLSTFVWSFVNLNGNFFFINSVFLFVNFFGNFLILILFLFSDSVKKFAHNSSKTILLKLLDWLFLPSFELCRFLIHSFQLINLFSLIKFSSSQSSSIGKLLITY